MSKLLKPIEYANELGISRQAVYAKIKKGLLTSKIVDGKIYIILDKDLEETFEGQNKVAEEKDEFSSHLIDVKELLMSKDQTISVLKESISDLKQTNTEINTTLRGEIELLKQVFTEMRNLYVKQVDYMSSEKHLEITEEECWITLSEFFERSSIHKNKKKLKMEKRFKKAYKKEDRRIKMEGEILYLSCYDFYEDILKK